MSTGLFIRGIWPELTSAVQISRKPCLVAVAYFGMGATRLLPLPPDSRLVVDASERAVASGQTCPAEIAKLVRRGVRVFSVPNLHAKVFVIGGAAYVGSTNVSGRSASQLIEAVIRTTDAHTVRAAREFIVDQCLHELTPGRLAQLSELYRPPVIPGRTTRERTRSDDARRPTLPRLLLAQLSTETWTDRDQELHDEAIAAAEGRRRHPHGFELDSFRYTGDCPFRPGDVVIQVTDHGDGRELVDAPGTVLHVRTRREQHRQVSFVYLERPVRRRRQLALLARTLGADAAKRLRRNGLVRNADFAQSLLKAWS